MSSGFVLDFWQSPPALGPQDPQDQRKNSKNPPKKRPKIVILGDFLRPEGLRQALKKQARKKDPQKGSAPSRHHHEIYRFGEAPGDPKSIKIVKMGCQKIMFFGTPSRNLFFTVSEPKKKPKRVENRWKFEPGQLRQRRSKKHIFLKATRGKNSRETHVTEKNAKRVEP